MNKDIAVESFRDDFDYFQATVRRAWRGADARVYVLRVNEKACADPPDDRALEGVLAHELAHLDSYTYLPRRRLLFLAWSYLVDPDGPRVRDYERETDRTAAAAGYAEDIIAYRRWLFSKLSPKDAERKRRTYLGDEELRRAERN